MAGIRHTTPADGSFTTEGASAWNGDEAHTLSDVASQTDLNTLSNAVSVADAALSARITSVAGLGGGGGSVTSTELSAVNDALSARLNSILSKTVTDRDALSIGLQDITDVVYSADADLSLRIDSAFSGASAAIVSVNNAISALSNANSASHVSIDTRINTVSNGLSVEIAARISADNALSAAINVVSNAASNALSVANAASNAASVVSVAAANALSVANAASNKASALSVAIAANSAQMTSADNAISAAVNVVSNAVSALSQANSVDHAALSARITSVAGLGGGGSVTSAEVNAVSVAAQSAINTLSVRIDSAVTANANNASVASQAASVATVAANTASAAANVASAAANTASNAASVAVQAASVASAAALALFAPQIRILSNTKSTAGSALVDVSGLVLTVNANETWEIQGMAAFSTSATTVGLRMGLSVPVLSTPRFGYINRISGGQSAGAGAGVGNLQISGSSVFMSITTVGPTGAVFVTEYKFIANVASAGTFRLQYGGIASTVASPIHIMPGSYFKAVRLK